ncbi:MAG: Smr/MutS family protein, partial [Kofleriaceae bacterium]
FDLARLEPTFKLHLGTPGSSGALAVALRTGIRADVVERARELMGPHVVKVEDLLASVADQQRRLEEERVALLAELEALEADRAASRAYRERAKQKFEKEARVAHSEALASLKAARREIEDVRREVRARSITATPEDIKAATRKLVTPGVAVAKHEPKRTPPPGTPATPELLVAGAPVIVPRLGRAEVVAILADGRVEVRVGSMRAVVPIKDTLIDTHRKAQRAERPAAAPVSELKKSDTLPGVFAPATVVEGRSGARTMDTTVDVRGNRVDEAVAQVDRFLDESLIAGRDTIFVIHGHGTGALRTAVRTHLAAHRGIDKFRAGEQAEGGDGVTVAFLK